MNNVDDSDIEDANDSTSKIWRAEPSFWARKWTENQFLKKYTIYEKFLPLNQK